ncbi:uncharacterized protein N7500_005589 [Penicillium coprophilum]|uniref:uncharacterized protein n=1 Tax=Penicillium coprophilum TaxID=36646 RepID=UPI00239D2EE7|nr:uncharacterized protein N7500_005589 [Penicillium coprophilum]KAJ5163759.1 hypothetical protein N7500_005589 [Penicillium coprophilum]
MENSPSISLVDNTVPQQPTGEALQPRTSTLSQQGSLTKHLSRASVHSQLAKRKYAKWQPQRLGIAPDTNDSLSRESSQVRGESISASSAGEGSRGRDVETAQLAPSRVSTHNSNGSAQLNGVGDQTNGREETKSYSEMDVLYENQRGCAWMTQDRRASPVNITNAQLPDPSWEWAWKTWYADMSGDTDEQGWQYSFSFSSSSWHGTQPWFHSFVRRRRWVRLRTKAHQRRTLGRSDFEKAHMLTEDYFTIHSSKVRSRDQSTAGLSRVESGLNRASMTVDEEPYVDEIGDIPSLMHALKLASIDREKIDALKKFIEDGGDELYYLNDKHQIPDIMPMFLFQTSRWQFVTYLYGVIRELSQTPSDSDKDADAIQRKKDNLARAAESCKRHITGPDVFKGDHGESATGLLDLTPVTKQDTLMSKRPVLEERARSTRRVFRGIPKAAEIDQPSSGHRLPVRRPAIFGAKRSIEKHLSNAPNSCPFIHVSGATRASSLMLLRGCPCLRRRVSAVLDTVATGPDEPLLFLYPRWAAPALQRRQISSLKPSNSAPYPSFSRHSRQWISSGSSSSAPDGANLQYAPPLAGEHLKINEGKEIGSEDLNKSGGGRLSAGQRQPINALTDVEHATPRIPLRGFALTRAKRIQKGRLHNKSPHAKPSSPTQKQLFLRNTSIRDRKKLRFREYMKKKYQARSAKLYDNAWFDTKDILDQVYRDIRKNPKKSLNKKEILVPEETLALFSGVTRHTLKDNIWYIPIHNGCRVHILPASQSKGLLRRVVLSATDHIMALVEGHFTRAQSLQAMGDPLVDIHKPPVPMCLSRGAMQRSKLPVPLIRGNWHFGETSDGSSNLDEILLPRPVIATVKEFNEHIEDVTSARQPTLDEKAMSLSKLPHVVRIKLHLEALFMAEAYSNYISTAALNSALEFLCRHEFLETARALCSCTEHVATTDTYNILLRAAARRQDVGVFRHFLRTMPKLDMRPNPETWLALLSALVVPSEKAQLIEHMVQRGHMSNLSTIHSALQETIQDSLLMFSVVARLKDFDSIDRLMEICIENNLTVDSYPLSHIVQALGAKIHMALHYTLRFFEHPLFEVTAQNWEDLFLAAFRRRQYNLCLVIWRYSCMKRTVTYKMKQAVLASLCRNASFSKSTKLDKDLWSSDAGKVIIGIDVHHESYRLPDSILNDIPSEFRHNPVLYLIGWKPRGEKRDLQIRLANALIKRDLILGATRYAPQHPSPIMLDAASILDKEWRGVPRPLTWKMQNAIQVPIVRKDQDRDQEKDKDQ